VSKHLHHPPTGNVKIVHRKKGVSDEAFWSERAEFSGFVEATLSPPFCNSIRIVSRVGRIGLLIASFLLRLGGNRPLQFDRNCLAIRKQKVSQFDSNFSTLRIKLFRNSIHSARRFESNCEIIPFEP
jgi:hypothetical protein